MSKDKQPEDVLIGRAVITTIQKLYDKGLFLINDHADEVLKDYLFFDKVNERRRPDWDTLIDDDDVTRRLYSWK